MTIRVYAQVLGVVLVLTGVLGLVLGERLLLGILNIDILEDIVHILTGAILAYVGFGRTDLALARNVVLGLGVVYLLVGLLGFVVPTLFGLLPDGYTIFDNLLHLALGGLSIAVAYSQPGTRRGAPRDRRGPETSENSRISGHPRSCKLMWPGDPVPPPTVARGPLGGGDQDLHRPPLASSLTCARNRSQRGLDR